MSNISVIQILRLANMDHKTVITRNSQFLTSVGVEYIVYDNLEKFVVLKFIRDIAGVKYYRKERESLRSAFLEAGTLARGERLVYLKSDDIITLENVAELEKIRPNILKSDLPKVSKIEVPDFKFADFYFLIKEKKDIIDRLKLKFLKSNLSKYIK